MGYPRKWLTSSIAGGVALGLVVGFSVKAVSGDDDDGKTNVDTGTTVVAIDTTAVSGTVPPTALTPETSLTTLAPTPPPPPPPSETTLPVDTTRRRRPRPTTTLPPAPPPPPPPSTTPFVTPPPIQIGS